MEALLEQGKSRMPRYLLSMCMLYNISLENHYTYITHPLCPNRLLTSFLTCGVRLTTNEKLAFKRVIFALLSHIGNNFNYIIVFPRFLLLMPLGQSWAICLQRRENEFVLKHLIFLITCRQTVYGFHGFIAQPCKSQQIVASSSATNERHMKCVTRLTKCNNTTYQHYL